MYRQIYSGIIEPVWQLASPKCCCVCGDVVGGGDGKHSSTVGTLCRKCLITMPLVSEFSGIAERLCGYLSKDEIALDGGAFGLINLNDGEEFIAAVYALKYRKYRRSGRELGRLLAEHVLHSGSMPECDLLVPVPLHPARKRSRGFNQAEEIAFGMSEVLKIEVSSDAVRLVNTCTQTQLSGAGRLRNVQNVFIAGSIFAGKSVMIVDDVFTTGATTNSLAVSLKQSGATHCYAACVAIA